MKQVEIIEHFRATSALLDGHFILSSGLHSSTYLQCALAIKLPGDAQKFAKEIAEKLRSTDIGEFDLVASPAIGGLVIGFATAQEFDLPFIWTERQEGVMTVRRGFSIKENQRFLVVEDVITTGGSTRECISALEKMGAKVVGAASIIDRSNGQADVGAPRIALASLEVPVYAGEVCPMCARGEIAVKPGSRSL